MTRPPGWTGRGEEEGGGGGGVRQRGTALHFHVKVFRGDFTSEVIAYSFSEVDENMRAQLKPLRKHTHTHTHTVM